MATHFFVLINVHGHRLTWSSDCRLSSCLKLANVSLSLIYVLTNLAATAADLNWTPATPEKLTSAGTKYRRQKSVKSVQIQWVDFGKKCAQSSARFALIA